MWSRTFRRKNGDDPAQRISDAGCRSAEDKDDDRAELQAAE